MDKGGGLWTAGRARILASVLCLLSFVLPFAAQADAYSDYRGSVASGDPQSVMLSYYDGPDTRGFAWQTAPVKSKTTLTVVETGDVWLLRGDFGSDADADFDTNRVVTATSVAQTDCYTHKAHVTGLSAGRYSYRLGAVLGTTKHYAYGKFEVREQEKPVVILNVNDVQTKDVSKIDRWDWTLAAAKSVLSGLAITTIVSGGDFIDNGTSYSNYIEWGVATDKANAVFPDVPWTMASGNHDYGCYDVCVAENFKYTTASSDHYGCHSFDYGNVHVATVPFTGSSSSDPTSLSSDVEEWLRSDLKAASAEWRIVVTHFGPYTTADHGCGANGNYIKAFASLCAECEVDLVLQGHDHAYSKTLPYLWSGNGYTTAANDSAAVNFNPKTVVIGGETYYDNPRGTVYVSAGCAGHRVGENSTYASTTYKNRSYRIVTDKVNVKSAYANVGDDGSKSVNAPMFAVLTVDSSTLKYDWYVAASSTPELFDTLRISKAPPEPPHDEDEAITLAFGAAATVTTITNQTTWSYAVTDGADLIAVSCVTNDDNTATFTFTGVEAGTATVVIYQEDGETPLKTVTVTVLPPDPMTTPIKTTFNGKVVTTVGAVINAADPSGDLILIYTNTAAQGSLKLEQDESARILVVGGGAGGVAVKAGKDSTSARRYTGNGGNSGEAEEFERALPAGQYAITIGKGGSSVTPAIESGTSYYDFTGDNPGQPSSLAGPSDFTTLTKNGGTAWATKNDDGSGAKASSKTASKAQDGSSASLTSDITGTKTTYAVGGTGGSSSSAERGADATPGTGNGGGGSSGGTEGADSGAGASGIVVVRIARVVEPIDMGGEAYVFERATTENQVVIENASAFEVADGFVLTAAELAKFRLNGVAGSTLAAALGGGSYTAGTFVLDEKGSPTLQGGTLGFTSSGKVSGVTLDGALTVDVASGATVTFADILRADGDRITVTGGGRVMFADDVIPETGSPDSSGKLYLCVGDKMTLRFGRSSTGTYGSTTWTATAGSEDIALDATSVSVSGANPANFTVTAQNENADGATLTVKRGTSQTFTYTVCVLPARRLQVGEMTQHWCNTAISGQTWMLSNVSAGLEAKVEKTESTSGLVSLTAKSLGAKQTVTATAGYAAAESTGALLGVSYVLATTVYEPVVPVETVFDGRTVTTVGAAVDTTSVPGELILIYTNTEEPGSLEIPEDATARILVVGGGAGGVAGKSSTSNKYNGNGGNGGTASEGEYDLPAGTYSITVGAGGASAVVGSTDFTGGGAGGKSSMVPNAGVTGFSKIEQDGGEAWPSQDDGGSGTKDKGGTAAENGSGANLTSEITGESSVYGKPGVPPPSDQIAKAYDGKDADEYGEGGQGSANGGMSGAGGSGIVIVRITGFGEVTPPGPPPVDPLVTNKISYVGLEGAANPNPTEFTTNDLPIVLSAPGARDGYTFAGWTPNGGVIPVGTVTDVTFTANWTAVEPAPTEKDEDVTIDVLAAGTSTNFVTVSKATSWTVDAYVSSNYSADVVRNDDGTATVTITGNYGAVSDYTITVMGDGKAVKVITLKKIGPKEEWIELAEGESFERTCAFTTAKTWSLDAPNAHATAKISTTASATSTKLTVTADRQSPGTDVITVRRAATGGSVDMYVYHVTVTAGETPPEPAKFCVTPYLQRPAPDAMTIVFFTDRACGATVTCGAQTTNTVGVWAEALTNNLVCGESSTWNNSLYKHSVRFTGLEPNGNYEYAVTLDGGASYTNAFHTTPDRNTPIRFVSYADCETTATPFENYVKNLAQMKSREPDFIAIPGDFTARGGIQSHWDGFWKANAGEKGEIAGSIPLLTVLGNHDLYDNGVTNDKADDYKYDLQGETGTERYLAYFENEPNGVEYTVRDGTNPEIPETRDLSQLFHRVDYGPVTLIFLDTNDGDDNDPNKDTNYETRSGNYCPPGIDRSLGGRHPDFNPGSPQYDWLTNQLADAQQKSRFTFVFNHHCPYSRGAHNNSPTSGLTGGSAQPVRILTETMVRYGVDGWYCGHDELLEHSITNGWEILPDGSRRKHTLSIYDLGCSGDSPRDSDVCKNPLEYWWSSDNYGGSGGYGFLETDVTTNRNGQWTCTITPIQGSTGKPLSAQVVYVENQERGENANDLVYAEAANATHPIDGASQTKPSDWLPLRPSSDPDDPSGDDDGGTKWQSSYMIQEGETTDVIWCEYVKDGELQTRWWKFDGGDASIATPAFVDANPNEPKMSGSPAKRAKFTIAGVKAGETTWTAYTYTDGGQQADGTYPGYSKPNQAVNGKTYGSNAWSDGSKISIKITVTAKQQPTPFELLCAAAAAGEAYVIEEDMEFPAGGVLTVPAGTSFVLDLKGHAITCHADGAIVNHGTLTILDSAKASPLAAHLTYSAAELGEGYSLVRSDGELTVDGVFVDAGFVNGADSEFGGGNTAIAATAGKVAVKNGAHVGGRTAIDVAGGVKVEVGDSHVAGWRGAAIALAGASSALSVSNSTLESEGRIVRATAGSATIVDSVLATSRTTAPFDLASGSSATVEKTIYVDRMAKWFPVTTALANDGADLKVGAGCLLAVASANVIGFLDEGVTAAEVATRVWRTKGADEEALPPLTPEEEARIAEVLSSSPDALLKANVTTIEDYTAYKAWVDAGVASGAIESEAAAKGAAGSFFSFATAQPGIVDTSVISDDKVKVTEMKVDGGEVKLTVGIEDLPVGENAQRKYLEQVFGVTGTGSLEKNDFAAEKVVYKQDMVRNADGTVSYTVEPKTENGEAKPAAFFFKASVAK